jgi:hypothetical protein
MSEPSSSTPRPQGPYAALANQPEPSGAMRERIPQKTSEFSFAEEAQRLAMLKTALWQGFLEAPQAGLPLGLIDLAQTYVQVLRMEVAMRVPGREKRPNAPPGPMQVDKLL